MFGIEYRPAESVVVSRETPVAVFLMEILAPATTEPEASVTVPARVAPVTCEYAGTAVKQLSARARNTPKTTAIFFLNVKLHSIKFLLTPVVLLRSAPNAVACTVHGAQFAKFTENAVMLTVWSGFIIKYIKIDLRIGKYIFGSFLDVDRAACVGQENSIRRISRWAAAG